AACGMGMTAAMLLLAAPLRAAETHNALTAEELAEGWILLFDGVTDFGWKAATEANWKVADGVISVSEGEPGLLATTSEFGDYQLRLDFRAAKQTNSGIFLRTPPVPNDPASDCYELNIAADDNPFPTGSFVKRQKTDGHTNGQWQSYDVTVRGDRFTVRLDGHLVLDFADPKPLGRGAIGLQLNSGPVEFRNIKLRPLGLEPIFNGRDLAGWHEFAGKPSVFSVTDEGALNVKNGPGQLESDVRFGDFVLQLEVFSNGRHLNSGIFFRSIPGEFCNGYESQIHNGFVDGDRTKPLDYGTGAFYRRQKARKVVSDDFQWFHKTLVVSGAHMAAWVNGYQVSDWTDSREPNANPRNGLRREAGTLIIQGHDPTTDLSFRNLRAAETQAR
ncbi:MAG: 3-keto-disaccharide hydrolase, partial [Terriglobales bacterium]